MQSVLTRIAVHYHTVKNPTIWSAIQLWWNMMDSDTACGSHVVNLLGQSLTGTPTVATVHLLATAVAYLRKR